MAERGLFLSDRGDLNLAGHSSRGWEGGVEENIDGREEEQKTEGEDINEQNIEQEEGKSGQDIQFDGQKKEKVVDNLDGEEGGIIDLTTPQGGDKDGAVEILKPPSAGSQTPSAVATWISPNSGTHAWYLSLNNEPRTMFGRKVFDCQRVDIRHGKKVYITY